MVLRVFVRRAQVEQAVVGAALDDPRGEFRRGDVVDLFLDHAREFTRIELHERTAVRLAQQRQCAERQGECREFLADGELRQFHDRSFIRRSTAVAPQKPSTAITTTANTTSPQGRPRTSGNVTWPIGVEFTNPSIAG